jgi:hypothetical protein
MSRVRLALLVFATAVLVVTGLAPAAPAAPAGPAWEVIVCSCKLCAQNPYVECQIGPGDGYSILCADYSRINC